MDRFDIQRAIIQYLEWCVNFNNHLGAESCEAPPTEALPDAAASGLGQWLSRNRRGALAHHPLFVELEQEHQRFHALAEQALTLTRNRKMGQASTLLNTDFERSRARVLGILRSLQRG